MITEKVGVCRVDPKALDQLLHPTFDPKAEKAAATIAKGLPASPGAATGQVVFTADEAEASEEKPAPKKKAARKKAAPKTDAPKTEESAE